MNRKLTKSASQTLLLDEALKFLMEAPEAELDQFLAETGEDVSDLNARSKGAFDAAFKRYGEHKRAAVKRGVAPVVQRLQSIATSLPTGRDELLNMAHELALRILNAGRPLSMQHRELTNLTDEDLRQAVAEMLALAEAAGDKKQE